MGLKEGDVLGTYGWSGRVQMPMCVRVWWVRVGHMTKRVCWAYDQASVRNVTAHYVGAVPAEQVTGNRWKQINCHLFVIYLSFHFLTLAWLYTPQNCSIDNNRPTCVTRCLSVLLFTCVYRYTHPRRWVPILDRSLWVCREARCKRKGPLFRWAFPTNRKGM